MHKMLFGSVALAAMLAGPAMAADMAVPRAVAAPPSWTGFYVGGNIGGVWGNTDPGFIASCGPNEAFAATNVGPGGSWGTSSGPVSASAGGLNTCYTAGLSGPVGANAAATAGNLNQAAAAGLSNLTQVGTTPFRNSGWTGGGQIGFNYQYQWAVFGIEADFQAFNPKGSSSNSGAYAQTASFAVPCSNNAGAGAVNKSTFGGCEFGFSESSSGKWLTTVRGKVGAVWGNWMVYGTAGLAYAKMSFASSFADNTCGAVTTGTVLGCNLGSYFSVRQTKFGPVGGAGLSYMLMRNWIVSVEYLYVSLDGYGGDIRAVNTVGSAVPAGVFGANFHYDTHFQENIVRAKLDYKF